MRRPHWLHRHGRVDRVEWLRGTIAEHGWAVQCVSDEDPSLQLAYTVGLTAHGHPEIVMTGLPCDVSGAFLNHAGRIIVQEGGHFVAGDHTNALADGPPLPVIAVEDTTSLVGVELVYGTISAVQIIWTDSQGNLPWEPGWVNPPEAQRLLGRRPQ